jgi:hypothetical protein
VNVIRSPAGVYALGTNTADGTSRDGSLGGDTDVEGVDEIDIERSEEGRSGTANTGNALANKVATTRKELDSMAEFMATIITSVFENPQKYSVFY